MNASNGGEQGNTYEFNCYFHEIEWFTDGQKHEKARKFNYFVKKNTVLSWLIFFFFSNCQQEQDISAGRES